MVERAIRTDWVEIAGPEIARRSRPASVSQGVLHVTVDNSPWLCELTMRSAELLDRVRARHGSAVTALRFSLGAAPPVPPAAPRPQPPRPSPLTAEDKRSVDSLTSSLSDPALASTLRRLVTKDLTARRRREAVAPPGEN